MGALGCSNHLAAAATFRCDRCDTPLCSDCVKRAWAAGAFVHTCLACGALLRELDPSAAELDTGAVAYLRRLPSFLMFPVQRSVLFLLLGLTVLTAPLYFAVEFNISPVLALLGLIFVLALEASIYFRFVVQTSHGEHEIDPPDFTDFWDDLVGPLVRYLFALAPIIGAVLWLGHEVGSYLLGLAAFAAKPTVILQFPGPAALLFVGLALLPLLTIIAAVSQSVGAVLNPALWIASLRVMGTTYLAAVAAFYGVLAIESLIWIPLLHKVQAAHSIPVVTAFIVLVLTYLPMALRARLLGGVVEPHLTSLRS